MSTQVSSDSKSLAGSCLCGAVRYSISGEPARKVLCHCTNCKKSSGTMFATNGFYAETVSSNYKSMSPLLLFLTWPCCVFLPLHPLQQVSMDDSSKQALQKYTDKSSDSGGILSRSFCSTCGSNMFVHASNFPGVIVVASGTLDGVDSLDWKPEYEFFCKRRGAWLESAGAPTEQQFQSMS